MKRIKWLTGAPISAGRWCSWTRSPICNLSIGSIVALDALLVMWQWPSLGPSEANIDPMDPVWALLFPESCLSPVYPQVLHIWSFIPIFLLFPPFLRPFHENCPNFYFCTIFTRGHLPPLSSLLGLLPSLGQPIFSLIWCHADITSKRGKM